MGSLGKLIVNEIVTAALQSSDKSMKENASAAENTGLEVRVTRTYDGIGVHNRKDTCQWCLDRCGTNMTLEQAYAKGAFQRHPGCGCIIEYTSAKGIKAVQTGKYSGWRVDEEIEKRKTIGLDEKFYADELSSRVTPYIDMDESELINQAFNGGDYKDTYESARKKTRPDLEKDIRGHLKATEEHEWKIQHPELYMKRDDPNDPEARRRAVVHWEGDRRRNARITRIEIEVWRRQYEH